MIPSTVLELVERFERNREAYQRPDYKEARVRVEFIDPFFEALGWDVRNVHGRGEHDKDVIYEDAIKVGGKTRAPDYSFRVGQARVFFLEAKKPAISLVGDVGPAYQLRRYSWSVKLPLGVLTDFEELAVYDCRQRPKPSDKASVGRIMYLTFDQYRDRWDEIHAVFAKESVQGGSFDQYVQETKTKRGASAVDAELLKEIENWREVLARNIALRNQALTVRELNFCVQRTIDRIIFLRMCEDRGIEEYGQLLALTTPSQGGGGGGLGIYPRLGDYYRRADEKYNAGLFDFQADTLTRTLSIDDSALKPILTSLYYPQCPYEFSVLPAEILGQVYEQFLGKVIRLTPSHRAKVEEKPTVKKAGGVYYTPRYIVDYIVRQTVGKLVEGQTPRQIAGARGRGPLRILDPACGSGSFLLGAYQYLLDYHRRWYQANDPAKYARRKQPAVYQGPAGEWRLTGAEKKRILLNNIYGVDIDRQAVEVSKLSLLLQVLEGETEETLGQQLSLWRERALPDLGDNIKCGNSLIGPDYFAGQLLPDEEEMRRVNPFDWGAEFPAVFTPTPGQAGGGFDCVIGNPPYIRIHNLVDHYPQEVRFIQRDYSSAHFGKVDIYVVFVEKSLQLLNPNGLLGFIIPNKFIQANYGIGLRKLLTDNSALSRIVDFRYAQVFENAATYTCLIFLSRKENNYFLGAYNTRNEIPRDFLQNPIFEELPINPLGETAWTLTYSSENRVLKKVEKVNCFLPDVAELIITGVKTGANNIFVFELLESDKSNSIVRSTDGNIHKIETNLLKPYWKAESIKRYFSKPGSRVVLYPYELIEDKTSLISKATMQSMYPNAWTYLKSNKPLLEGRQKGKLKGPYWYGLSFASSLKMFSSKKIITATLAPKNSFMLDDSNHLFPQGAGGGCGIIVNSDSFINYLLGLLNSRLLTFYFQHISSVFRSGWFAYEPRYLYRIPIRTINFNDPAEVARHEQMVSLVERMLALHQKLSAANIPADKQLYQRQIEATDRAIDALVYQLYRLTQEEIKIVAGGMNS